MKLKAFARAEVISRQGRYSEESETYFFLQMTDLKVAGAKVLQNKVSKSVICFLEEKRRGNYVSK